MIPLNIGISDDFRKAEKLILTIEISMTFHDLSQYYFIYFFQVVHGHRT